MGRIPNSRIAGSGYRLPYNRARYRKSNRALFQGLGFPVNGTSALKPAQRNSHLRALPSIEYIPSKDETFQLHTVVECERGLQYKIIRIGLGTGNRKLYTCRLIEDVGKRWANSYQFSKDQIQCVKQLEQGRALLAAVSFRRKASTRTLPLLPAGKGGA